MSEPTRRLAPGTLWPLIVERARRARHCGALSPIETETHVIDDHGVKFQVRVVSSLVRKEAAGATQVAAARPNPFLPYEPDLFVADISETHLCLLNKYNVIDHHALVVTRAFEPQERRLTLDDFEALWRCMAEYEALAFYNSGPAAGASQPHKHLQLVPLPLTRGGPALPVESLLGPARAERAPAQIERLPFRHAFAWLDAARLREPGGAATYTHALYLAMLAAVGFDTRSAEPPPYNLLVTRRFMLLVPRTRAGVGGVPVNALGFAGSFFIPRPEWLEVIRHVGPMTVLREVALAPLPSAAPGAYRP